MLNVYIQSIQGNTSPERENALSGGYVTFVSKFAPSSCYKKQRLGKKKIWQHRKLPALLRNLNVKKSHSPKDIKIKSHKNKKVY